MVKTLTFSCRLTESLSLDPAVVWQCLCICASQRMLLQIVLVWVRRAAFATLCAGGFATLLPASSLATTSVNLGCNVTNSWLNFYANQQLNPATMLTARGSTWNAKVQLNGTTQTVAGINNVGGVSIIQNLETGGSGTGLLLVSNNTINSTWSGYLRNMSGTLALSKDGLAQLTLSGANCSAVILAGAVI